MATTENVITLTRQLLREEDTSDVPVVADSFLFEAIIDGQSKWEDSFQIGGENPIRDQLDTGYDLVNDTKLDADVTDATVSFVVDDDNDYDDTNGALIIWDDNMMDIIDYTTWTSKTFSGVTGIAFDHEADDTVQKLYKLPSNFGSFRESPLYGDGVRLNGMPLRYINTFPISGFFSEYDNGTNRFLILPRSSTGSASVLFNKAYEIINSLDDVVSVPDKYKFFLIYHCISIVYQDVAGDEVKANNATIRSDRVLSRALTTRNTGKKIRTRPFGRRAVDSVTVGGFTYPWY